MVEPNLGPPSATVMNASPPETFLSEFPEGAPVSQSTQRLFARLRERREAVAGDDLTLQDLPSSVAPHEVDLRSWITRNISLKGCGILGAAMDTVTEHEMALALAKAGGVGVIHQNLSIAEQCRMVRWVRQKINCGGMIENPITCLPTQRVSDLQVAAAQHNNQFRSFPIVDASNHLLGIVTCRNLEFVDAANPCLGDIMTPVDSMVLAPEGTDSHMAFETMRRRRIKRLPVVAGKERRLVGVYIWRDIKRDHELQSLFSIDREGHFLVGGAIGARPQDLDRADALVEAGCKLLLIDSSHGACREVVDMLAAIRARHGNAVDVIVGNVASYEGARYLLAQDARPDAIKVGIGPGSICTTRVVTGHGVPQLTAVYEAARAVRESGYPVPIIADGGIRSSGDVVKLMAAGASGFMLGSLLAGADESPAPIVSYRNKRFKRIRGMGSLSAMVCRSGSRTRYGDANETQSETTSEAQRDKIAPEGVEGLIELSGSVSLILMRLCAGVRSGLGHSGAGNIRAFQERAQFWRQSSHGIAEGHPHDLMGITE